MDFTYSYKTPDGVRHEADITAPDREAAYAALRERGIRAIKVVPKGLTEEEARAERTRLIRRGIRLAVAAAAIAAAAAGIVFWSLGRWSVGATAYVRTDGAKAKGANKLVAAPMTRRQIRGDEQRIREATSDGAKFIFSSAAEAYLAAYAIPGAPVPEATDTAAIPAEADFLAALEKPIYTFPDEIPEYAELKRIVAGMKEEAKMFLASGGSVADYMKRLQERQRMESDYRAKAEAEIMEDVRAGRFAPAYAKWEEKNEWLSAMGIAVIPLPAPLSVYQSSLDN